MVNYLSIIMSFFFGTIPALIWLFFFLPEDKNPECKKKIIEVFLSGMIFALIAIFPIFFIKPYIIGLMESSFLKLISFYFFGCSVVFLTVIITPFFEEIAKYLSVKFSVFKSKELDEPVDFMIYMIVAALGFSAMENILYSFEFYLSSDSFYNTTLFVVFYNIIRFIGATFLHALASAILGYFWALSFYHLKHKKKIMVIGFILAIFLHGLFNWVIIAIEQAIELKTNPLIYFLLLILLISSMLIFVLKCFEKLKKIKSICQKTF